MDKGNIHIDEGLLMKFLSGEADESERREVERWKDMSPENSLLLQKLEGAMQTRVVPKSASREVNVDKAWMNLKNRMEEEKKDVDSTKEVSFKTSDSRGVGYYMIRVAAVFVFGMLIYMLFKWQESRVGEQRLVAENVVIEDTLSDGTHISLNQGSKIEFPKKFEAKERRVSLEGEAYFKVSANKEKPFVIQTRELLIRVVGTEFNVRAIPEDNREEVVVEEGIVELESLDKKELIRVMAGEKGFYNKVTNTLEKEKIFNPNDLFWKHKTLIFSKTELSVVFMTLEEVFDVQITTSNPDILRCKLSGKFKNESVEDIIKNIIENFGLDYEMEGKKIIIKGNGCS